MSRYVCKKYIHQPLWRWEIEREWTKTVGAMLMPRYVCKKYIHRPLWRWETEREWTKTVGAMLMPRYVCNKYILPTKSVQMLSWRHPRSRHWHQMDIVIIIRPLLISILVTRSCHSVDCDTDHSFVGSTVRLRPKRINYSKPKGCPRINITRTSIPDACVLFTNIVEEAPRPA